jgi:hypothetical protein
VSLIFWLVVGILVGEAWHRLRDDPLPPLPGPPVPAWKYLALIVEVLSVLVFLGLMVCWWQGWSVH